MAPVEVTFNFWLALRLDERGAWHDGCARLAKRQPELKSGEIAVKVALTVPHALFEQPTLKIVAKVPVDSALAVEIPAEVQDNITELVREQTGLLCEISVPEEET